jgi:hypothetical protein
VGAQRRKQEEVSGKEVSGMVEPINLNKVRKARERASEKTAAAENRIRFGRAKSEKTVTKLEAERARRAHDQTKRED